MVLFLKLSKIDWKILMQLLLCSYIGSKMIYLVDFPFRSVSSYKNIIFVIRHLWIFCLLHVYTVYIQVSYANLEFFINCFFKSRKIHDSQNSVYKLELLDEKIHIYI